MDVLNYRRFVSFIQLGSTAKASKLPHSELRNKIRFWQIEPRGQHYLIALSKIFGYLPGRIKLPFFFETTHANDTHYLNIKGSSGRVIRYYFWL